MQLHYTAPEEWLTITDRGLYCIPGDFVIDPVRPAARALITHGHGDHARGGNGQVLATGGTIAVMQARFGEWAGQKLQAAYYGEMLEVNGVKVTFFPAGHILGSSQILLEYGGSRVVISGDYKRRYDPTCEPFIPIPCDVFITEATFGLPVFTHPNDAGEIAKILDSLALYPERAVLIGAYALGKCQRILCRLREEGYHEPVYLHGALLGLCALYERYGVQLGKIIPFTNQPKDELRGKIVIAPPSALHDRWSRRLPDPLAALASGWMTVRARARQKLVELPLIISDHADWPELTQTLQEVAAPEIWVTHGEEEALVYWANLHGFKARPLDLRGYESEGE